MPIKRSRLVTAVAIGGAALGGATLANAATKSTTKTSTTSSASAAGHGGNPNETRLTGDTLKSASEAAIAANSGAKVDFATTEDAAENTAAAYEVHITKADGTRATVLEDKDFKVLSTNADQGHGGFGGHHGGPGGPGGPGGNPDETPLTGDALAKANAAAQDAVSGATVDAATTEDPAENTGAAYEVHAHKGTSFITILLDKDFKVVKTETGQRHHR